ncbi:MAG: YncE family protein, partial [Thermoanaerobaculia bacterium]
MGPQHSFRGVVMPLVVFVAFAFTPALSSAPAKKPPSESYTLFESGQVRPLAMSPDRQRLFAVNTPDNRLEVFRIQGNRLLHTASIPVGMEPVAAAARTDREVWVVNHLSDSVSVVELDD